MKMLLAALFLASVSAHAETAPANQCQAKAIAVAKAEALSALGASDLEVLGARQTNWVVSISFYSPSRVSDLNPAGSIEALVGIKDILGGDCTTTSASIDEYDVRG